ncbi:hypothetical protein LNV23_14455 [Paucibacter sp. DJ1R-11]|uniref:hypothetical protein n=1 Tax=Paucibacter sp. DJ1R-11 TaxID=2893556 RepID=UPI0021E37FFB|nr:hypothetical protein [Paucibacter sp. DJ1R-11]MCV2364652.1 hypothetical protein [Paucibacter sp. DJ1R-11]
MSASTTATPDLPLHAQIPIEVMTLHAELAPQSFPSTRAYVDVVRRDFIDQYLKPEGMISAIDKQGKHVSAPRGRPLFRLGSGMVARRQCDSLALSKPRGIRFQTMD